MEDWKVRLKEETEQLGTRIEALNTFIESGKLDELKHKQAVLLDKQHTVMMLYYAILLERCKTNDIEVVSVI